MNKKPDTPEGERIAKIIARSGFCSRREAEKLIEQERVKMDGKIITTPATFVTDKNEVRIDGTPIKSKEETKLWIFSKPQGVLVTSKDPQGRKTIYDILPKNTSRLIPIGRLDYNTEGLLLLTNDGALSRHLELPSSGWIRKYRVRAYGQFDEGQLDLIRNGVQIDGVKYRPAKIELEKIGKEAKSGNNWFTISIKEGKNREVRKLFEHIGLKVNRLIRTSYGPFSLGDIVAGELKGVPRKYLREQIGKEFIN